MSENEKTEVTQFQRAEKEKKSSDLDKKKKNELSIVDTIRNEVLKGLFAFTLLLIVLLGTEAALDFFYGQVDLLASENNQAVENYNDLQQVIENSLLIFDEDFSLESVTSSTSALVQIYSDSVELRNQINEGVITTEQISQAVRLPADLAIYRQYVATVNNFFQIEVFIEDSGYYYPNGEAYLEVPELVAGKFSQTGTSIEQLVLGFEELRFMFSESEQVQFDEFQSLLAVYAEQVTAFSDAVVDEDADLFTLQTELRATGILLNELIEELGLTHEQLAERATVSAADQATTLPCSVDQALKTLLDLFSGFQKNFAILGLINAGFLFFGRVRPFRSFKSEDTEEQDEVLQQSLERREISESVHVSEPLTAEQTRYEQASLRIRDMLVGAESDSKGSYASQQTTTVSKSNE